jgi:hypothetical protein
MLELRLSLDQHIASMHGVCGATRHGVANGIVLLPNPGGEIGQ